MNKDKEWLKEEMKDEELNLKYVHDNYVPYEKVLIADDVYDLIDQLDEPQQVVCAENERTTEIVEITEEQAWEIIGGYNGMTAKEANQMFADGMVNRNSDKSIKRDDVLDRLQEIGEHNRNEWIEVILRKFGNAYGTAKYREGYEQGVLNGILTSNKNKLVEVPQFVAKWIEFCKKNEVSLAECLTAMNIDHKRAFDWINSNRSNMEEIVARAWLDGYSIEPPKTLQVIVKNYDSTVFTTELPEDEARKLIEGWKEDE